MATDVWWIILTNNWLLPPRLVVIGPSEKIQHRKMIWKRVISLLKMKNIELCNSSDKSTVCSAKLSANYRGHVTQFVISIKSQTTQPVHRYTVPQISCIIKLPGFMWQLHLVNDDLWRVIVPIRYTDRNIMRMESDELFISLWYYMEPCWVEKDSLTPILLATQLIWVGAVTTGDNTDQNRLPEYYVGGSAIKMILSQ